MCAAICAALCAALCAAHCAADHTETRAGTGFSCAVSCAVGCAARCAARCAAKSISSWRKRQRRQGERQGQRWQRHQGARQGQRWRHWRRWQRQQAAGGAQAGDCPSPKAHLRSSSGGARACPSLSLARASALLRSVVRSSSGLRARAGSFRIAARLLSSPCARVPCRRCARVASLLPLSLARIALRARASSASGPPRPNPAKRAFFSPKKSHRQPPPRIWRVSNFFVSSPRIFIHF